MEKLTKKELDYLKRNGIEYPWKAQDLLRLQKRLDKCIMGGLHICEALAEGLPGEALTRRLNDFLKLVNER